MRTSMTLVELADEIGELAEIARAGKTAPAEMTGGTFSITNVGVFGVDAGTPILDPGEAGILALGAVRRQPWEHRGEIALRDVMTLSLSFDHRLVDGEQGAEVPGGRRRHPAGARPRDAASLSVERGVAGAAQRDLRVEQPEPVLVQQRYASANVSGSASTVDRRTSPSAVRAARARSGLSGLSLCAPMLQDRTG